MSDGGPAVVRRMSSALLAAAVGAAAGYAYAAWRLPPHILEGTRLPALYATAGAVIALVGLRLGSVLLLLWRTRR